MVMGLKGEAVEFRLLGFRAAEYSPPRNSIPPNHPESTCSPIISLELSGEDS